jgi:hypothetical protein
MRRAQRGISELEERIAELRDAFLNAKDEILSLKAELLTLKYRQSEKQAWDATAARYLLVQAPGGGMVLRTVVPPAHYACPRCFLDQNIYPLERSNSVPGALRCPGCHRSFLVDDIEKPAR